MFNNSLLRKIAGYLTVILCLTLSGCSSSDSDDNNFEGRIVLQNQTIDFSRTAQFMQIESNTGWILETVYENPEDEADPWCYVVQGQTQYAGSGNQNNIILRTYVNYSHHDRSVVLVLKAQDQTVLYSVTLTQTGDPSANPLSVRLRASDVPASGGTEFLSVSAMGVWELSVEYPQGTQPWVTGFTPSSGTDDINDVVVSYTANETGSDRSAYIILTSISDGVSVRTTLLQRSGLVTADPVITLNRPVVESTETSQTVSLVYNNAWQLSVEYPSGTAAWVTIGTADRSGTGDKVVTITYAANSSETARQATLVLRATDTGNEDRKPLIQNGRQFVPTPTGWLELPAMNNLSPTEKFVTHFTPINGRSVRNYSMLFDTGANRKIAYWVAYPHHTSYIGNSGRTNKWAYDPSFTNAQQPHMKSGLGGYDRGHQIPSGDRTVSKEANWQTFYYTNMTAQLGALNQKVWATLENNFVREKWLKGQRPDTLYIVTGGVLQTVGGNETVRTINDNSGKKLAVPNYYFKALLYRKGSTYRAIGFWFEHRSYGDGDVANVSSVLRQQAVSIRRLEELTGFDFFPNLRSLTSDYDQIESTVTPSAWGL